jgi:hypothetical protein
MKEVSAFTPFFTFTKVDEEFIGFYQGNQEIQGKKVPSFLTNEGDEFLLGGGQLSYLASSGKFTLGKKYKIIFIGDEKITEGKFKGKSMHKFKVLEFDDDDELK